MVLSWIYAAFGKVDVVQAFFFGLKAAVRIAKRLRMKVDMPALGSINAPSLVLTLAALIAVFRFKLGMIKVLLACSLTGLLFYMVSGHAG
jgi:chromate transporter